MNRKPLFLDRDGVLNVDLDPYVTCVEDFELFPWTVDALQLLHDAGYDLYVISNQQGVALGLYTEETLRQIDAKLQAAIAPRGFQIRKIYYCTLLRSEAGDYRKPGAGMVFRARDEFGLDLRGAFFIGDQPTDIECAHRAGLRPILVLSGVSRSGDWHSWPHQPERVFANLLEAAEWIVGGQVTC
ncbi:MAG: HAD-IIIA family hydrolase [Fimbriimonadales bacterium]|nr:HAD-IIIA family hydrolase [Fimbriimonadales bacterium]